MAFANRFAFSFSSYAQFTRCRREWALHRMRAWNGWARDAAPERQVAYRATKMLGYSRLAGDLVHVIAHDAVAGRLRDAAAAKLFFHTRWRNVVEASRQEYWRSVGPKKAPPLFEHYYQTASPEHAGRVVERAVACIDNLFALPELEEIRGAPLLQMEELESFYLDGILIWAKPDLAYWRGSIEDGHLVVWDWKTGRERAKDARQVLLYALFGAYRWEAVPERTRLFLGYLAEPCVEEVAVDRPALRVLAEEIQEGADRMRAHLPDPDIIEGAQLALYPRTDDLAACQRCDFFEACKGHRDLSRPDLIMEDFE